MIRPPHTLLAAPVAALVVAGSLLATATSASADDAATVVVQPLTSPGVPLTGPFSVRADVTMGAATSVVLTPGLLYSNKTMSSQVFLEAKTVGADTCPTTCQVEWSFDPTSKATAWADGSVSISVAVAQGQDPVVYARATGGTFVSPVADLRGAPTPFERTETANTSGYAAGVMDTTGVVRVTSTVPRTPGEVLVLTLRKGSTPQDVASFVGSWNTPDPVTGVTTGQVSVNVSQLPEPGFGAYVQGKTTAGQFGAPRYLGTLSVRHSPMTSWLVNPVLTGSPVTVQIIYRYPAATAAAPYTVEIRLNTGAVLRFAANFWTASDLGVQLMQATIPPDSLPPGTTMATGRLLNDQGAAFGPPVDFTIPVATFNETVTSAPLVVGLQLPVTVKGKLPAGLAYSYCDFKFYDPAGLNPYTDGTVCFGGTSFTTTVTPLPRVAGPARFELTPVLTAGLQQLRTFPVTVYSERAATFTAPASSAYKGTLAAAVRVTDRFDVAKAPRAVPGVTVYLQRKIAGTTSWSTIATGRTDTLGRATISFANIVSGTLRVVVPSAVPRQLVISGERSITSVSTLRWSPLPTSTYRNSPVTAKVVTAPYERGARVLVQARLRGTRAWLTVSPTVAVSSTGYAAPQFRIETRGTWDVRVVRLATTRYAVGLSTTRSLTVR